MSIYKPKDFYQWMLQIGDPRVENWFLMRTPLTTSLIFVLYLLIVFAGPKIMMRRNPVNLKNVIIPYNAALVLLSCYMFYEFLVSSFLAGYSYKCQPVDYSDDPLALRMASVCWWFFFSKIIELLDTVFFILRKKNNQVTFLHVYHHCTMIINWWLGVKYVAGGQSFFLAMLNSYVHIFMYTYYALAAFGPHMQKYLWWKKYMTKMQLVQFFAVLVHTGYNMTTDCDFPMGFNYAVFGYAISLVFLFSNFYHKSYITNKKATYSDSGSAIGSQKAVNGTANTYNLRQRSA